MNRKLIYVADDELNICNLIKSYLENEGYQVNMFSNGQSIFDAFLEKPADMLIIDIMMPGLDGYSLCTKIRQSSNVPMIMVSARDTEPDKIAGLTLGSDDYLTKPFSPMELVARVKTIFRRIELDRSAPDLYHNTIHFCDITIYPDRKYAECSDNNLGLSLMEYNFLTYLIYNKNKAVSRNELLNKIWGFESESETRAVDDMVKRIRKKLSTSGSSLSIETVWGFGYMVAEGSGAL